ncbi:MAG: Gfo/Idh/MocA family oxidoreductase [Bryobacterales bacterium]|nr:Gfo/Idh/MocA family oxidoreductase [Acidobacteriota bacterium]MCB9384095.1 Gfo/Idh/MocA family oxidoreductase [Bryobacterales bacterium]
MADVRWGLIGCGDIARKRVAPALRDAEGGRLVSVSRARADLAADFAKEFGAAKWYPDWRGQVHDSDIDAVYVATPVDLHAEQTVVAAEAGKHVLCEKPMALDVASCDRMIAACKANNVRLGVAYYRRFYPVVKRIKEMLDWEEFGRIVIAQVNAFESFNPKPWEPRAWLVDPAQAGGGPMMDFGSHRVELLLNLLGPVGDVKGFLDRIRFDRKVEDTGLAVMRFEAGARAQITVTHAAAEPRDTLDIYGTAGSIHVESLNRGDLRIVGQFGDRQESHPPHANLHQPLVEDFIQALRKMREPAVSGEAGREVQRVLETIYRE